MAFCLSQDDDKQKHVSIEDNNRIEFIQTVLNRRHTLINTDYGQHSAWRKASKEINRRFTQIMPRAKTQRTQSSEKIY